ncbi:MAG: hypothetical protein ACW981_13200 [Candidatus Hodarchaeales archaeon]|jgi:UDP-N-acetylmuramyl pentapeptide phosphotransferase/UDP-N-acetylglucosamine-1-phosphate transferase
MNINLNFNADNPASIFALGGIGCVVLGFFIGELFLMILGSILIVLGFSLNKEFVNKSFKGRNTYKQFRNSKKKQKP